MTISEDTVNNILRCWPVGVLSTYGRDKIHSVPIVFVAIDDEIYSPIDAKPKSGRTLQRIVDLARDQRFTLLLQHYEDDWKALWWLRVSGHGEVVSLHDLNTSHADVIVGTLHSKYRQYELTAVLDNSGQLLRLKPVDQVAWASAGQDCFAQRFN